MRRTRGRAPLEVSTEENKEKVANKTSGVRILTREREWASAYSLGSKKSYIYAAHKRMGAFTGKYRKR